MDRLFDRLDALAAALSRRPDAVALLGLGSVGAETARIDEFSDLDFFVVVEEGAKPRYLASIDWLEAAAPVAFSFRNDPNGRKALFTDGIYAEYAVFTLPELAAIPYTGGRVVWRRGGFVEAVPTTGRLSAAPAEQDGVEFHLGEALTNLYVGLCRDARGERLSALRFIQSLAVDRVIALHDLGPDRADYRRDPFDRTRRVEEAYADSLPLAAMTPGYHHNRDAARAVLTWLEARYPVDAALGAEIRRLLG